MKFARAELVEGAMVLYRGCVWIAKGLVHPPRHVVALPRYTYDGRWRKLTIPERIELLEECSRWWSYVQMRIPQIPRDRALPIEPRLRDQKLQCVFKLVRDGLSEFTVFLTGSSALGMEEARDLDFVIVCRTIECSRKAYSALQRVGEPMHGLVYSEWLAKHSREIDFHSYAALKERSVLLGTIAGVPYSARIVCLELSPARVLHHKFVEDVIEIRKPVSPYTTPCLYIAESKRFGRIVVESHRILFAELPIGTRIEAVFRIEYRSNGVRYAVPDHSNSISVTT